MTNSINNNLTNNNKNEKVSFSSPCKYTLQRNLAQYPQKDTVTISPQNKTKKKKEEKKGLSSFAKFGIGASITAGLLISAAILIQKRRTDKISELYDSKLILSNLKEHIDFKEATTVDEGIKFAKEVLGIKDVDKTFTLDAINFVNHGLVDVSNANNGKLFMPTKLRFEKMKNDGVLAYVNRGIHSSDFGILSVNKKYFDENFINQKLKNIYDTNKYSNANNTSKTPPNKTISVDFRSKDTKYIYLRNKYIKDNNSLSFEEKRYLYFNEHNFWEVKEIACHNPLIMLTRIKDGLKTQNIHFDYDEIKKLPKDKQADEVIKLAEEYYNTTNKKESVAFLIPSYDINHIIHHEMGHLQDYAKNLKKLALQDIKNKDDANKVILAETNRWARNCDVGKIINNRDKYPQYKGKSENEVREALKKAMPDLYEFVNNQETQKAASEISSYAQQGIGEFIAETYAEMIAGHKLSKEVIELYKKYDGPIPVNYPI